MANFNIDKLLALALGKDPLVGAAAGKLLNEVVTDTHVPPPHCGECFEGCPKCNWGKDRERLDRKHMPTFKVKVVDGEITLVAIKTEE